jgi:hypothetical protein
MNLERAAEIFSLSADARWKALIAEIDERQQAMADVLFHPKTPHDMTQFHRGGYAFAADMKRISQEAYDIIKSKEGSNQ